MWAKCYMIVPLAAIMSDGSSSRVSIRTVADLVFPEIVSFPLRQRLTLQGSFVQDANLPEPFVSDDAEGWEPITGEAGDADIDEYDGMLEENAPRYRKLPVAELMM